MRIHVLGLGSVGSLLSHHLRRSLPDHHTVILIYKTQHQANLASRKGSKILLEVNGAISAAEGFAFESFNLPGETTSQRLNRPPVPIDSLFVTTKAHQTVPAIQRIAHRLSQNSTIVLLQNGMGVYEELTHHIFRNPATRPHFILASNTHGVYGKKLNHFVHAGIGRITFGIVVDPNGRDVEAAFNDESVPKEERMPRLSDISPGPEDPSYERYKSLRGTVAAFSLLEPLNVSWRPMAEVQTLVRQKVVVNAVINSLTAIMGCRNGDLFRRPESKRIAASVCLEAEKVFRAQFKSTTGTWLESLASSGVSLDDVSIERMPHSLTKDSLEMEIHRVAQITAGNISSMLADIRRGRPTEVDFINGYLLRIGRNYNIPMPTTAALLNLVKMRQAIPLDQSLP